jgi:FkbM family methyltransferase
LLPAGTCAIDGGAHVGGYTRELARIVGVNGHVFSIEPIPELASYLKKAVANTNLPVTVIEAALGSKKGIAALSIPIEENVPNRGAATILPVLEGKPARTIPVNTITLDSLLPLIFQSVSFLKLDIEGAELDALAGAAELLTAHRPILLLELNASVSHRPLSETHAYLGDYGYEAWVMSEQQWSKVTSEKNLNDLPVNVFFFHRSSVPCAIRDWNGRTLM